MEGRMTYKLDLTIAPNLSMKIDFDKVIR